MLYDAISVFEKKLNAVADRSLSSDSCGDFTDMERCTKYIVDNYVPKDGIYVLVNMDDGFCVSHVLEFKFDKATGGLSGSTDPYYSYIRYLDYNSKLVAMNKPVRGKVIHSSHMYSFFVKKDSVTGGKLTEDVVSDYYNVLRKPECKYLNDKARNLYNQIVSEIGEPDGSVIDQIELWIKNWFFVTDVSSFYLSGKDYVKFFFVHNDVRRTKELYERENKRYVIPNIYNNNDYNVVVNDVTFGVPSHNVSLNSKKPFLESKSRKTRAPYLVGMDRIMLHSWFFDWLWGCACKGNVNVYFDFETGDVTAVPDKDSCVPFVKSGLYFRIKKGKEVEILDSDVVIDIGPNLPKTFCFKNILNLSDDDTSYGEYTSTVQMAAVIDEVFFDKYLKFNYFTDPFDLPSMDGMLKQILLTYRSRIFAWLYRTPVCNMGFAISDMAFMLMKNKILFGYFFRAGVQLNLMLSLEDYFNNNDDKEEFMKAIQTAFKTHIDMVNEEWDFTDGEYYYAVGQLVRYFISLSKSAKKPLSMANQFLNANNDNLVKEKLCQMFIHCDHAIDADKDVRVKNVVSHIMTYEPECRNVMLRELIAGLTGNSAFYMKKNDREDL